jgi:hypothetical protein
MDTTGCNRQGSFDERLLSHMRADRQQIEDYRCALVVTHVAVERSIRAIAESRKLLNGT